MRCDSGNSVQSQSQRRLLLDEEVAEGQAELIGLEVVPDHVHLPSAAQLARLRALLRALGPGARKERLSSGSTTSGQAMTAEVHSCSAACCLQGQATTHVKFKQANERNGLA